MAEKSSDNGVWYFAYGSNMRSSVMSGRGLVPAASQKVVVPSHVLTFDVFGVPYSEPAMASIAKRSSSSSSSSSSSFSSSSTVPAVQGIAYLISHAEYKKLVISEGAGIAYEEVVLEAQVSEKADERIHVRTLVARYPFRPNAAPSERYLNLLIQGAEEHNLLASYQEYLRALPRFNRDHDLVGWRIQMGAAIFLAFWPRLIGYLMRWIKTRATRSRNSQAPLWMGDLVWALFGLMWFCHDNFHGVIWGKGDGRPKERSKGTGGRLGRIEL